MNTYQIRKFIYFNFLLLNVVNPSYSSVLTSTSYVQDKVQNSLNELKDDKYSLKNGPIKDILEINQKLAYNQNSYQTKQLEIQSDKQYQENNVIYAEGNVLVTYRGNSLKADSLVYDKSNETVSAKGNILLILGDQVFSSEKIYYDFKTQNGLFLKVKSLIKTKNLLENLDLASYDSDYISSITQFTNKKKVLYTPDGINNWIFYTEELKVEKNQWLTKKAIFTNDLLETNQVKFEINALKIIPKKDEIKLNSSISYLILEDNLSIPFFFGNKTLKKSKDGQYIFDFESKWYLGVDNVDKDGYFIGRKLKPLNISDDFILDLEPQFLIQRSLQGYTNSFVNKGDSVTAEKSKRNASFSDYFSLNTGLKGKINSWDLEIEKKLYSFDFDKFSDALRLKVNLSKEIDFFNSRWDKSFYAVYRDRIWNGSIGESEIYIGYGSKLEKVNTWEVDGIIKTERINMGLGEFHAEELNSKNLVSSYKGSVFYSLDQKFPWKVKESENKFVDNSFDYIFEPVKQGIHINTKLAALYSFYENGNHQEYISVGAGPEVVFGEFKKKFLDYTRFSVLPVYRIKSGDSPFKFDQVADKFTLDLAFDQQLYGPVLLQTMATLNLDGKSKDYGDFINSKISLNWKKRSYQVSLFYQPHNQSGGLNFTLFGFK